MIYISLMICSLYMFVCSASLAEDFDLVEDKEGAQILTFGISVLLFMLARVVDDTPFGSYMISAEGFDLLSFAIIIALSYLALDCIEKIISKSSLFNARNIRTLNAIPRKDFW